MKLLFDENLSPRLVDTLSAHYPDGIHVRNVGLLSAADDQIWDYSRAHGFVIVSKDTDFRERSFVEGFPPKVIWLDIGNAGTTAVSELLIRERALVEEFARQEEPSFLILSFGSNSL